MARQHDAKWAETPTWCRRPSRAKDLPATFEIDLPTAEGRYPVYPKMIFVRREVAAGGKPLPLPEGSAEPKAAADDELKTLPNPFLIGTGTPPAIKPRAVKKPHAIAAELCPILQRKGRSRPPRNPSLAKEPR